MQSQTQRMDRASVVCKVCLKQFAKYTCPRCNCPYCSLPCFKQHGQACTESFYRDQAVGQLQGIHANDADKRKVLDILQRFHAQTEGEGAGGPAGGALGLAAAGQGGWEGDDRAMRDSDEEAEEEEGEEADAEGRMLDSILSEQTLARLLSKVQQAASSASAPADLEQLLEEVALDEGDLTPQELKALQRAAATGSLSHLLEPWHPWWLSAEAKELRLGATGLPVVAELSATVGASGQQQRGTGGGAQPQRGRTGGAAAQGAAAAGAGPSGLPAPPHKPLPALSSLSRSTPSPLLRWHLVEVLYAYCWVMRAFNGDVTGGLEPDVADLTLALAAALAPPAPRTPSGVGEAGAGDDRTRSSAAAESGPRLASEAVLGCLSRACQPPVGGARSRPQAVAALGDVAALMGAGRSPIILALAHLQAIMDAASEQMQGMEASAFGPKASGAAVWSRGRAAAAASAQPIRERRAAVKAAARKLLFLCCWANEQDETALEAVHGAVEAEWRQHQSTVPSAAASEGSGGEGGGRAGVAGIVAAAAARQHSQQQPQGGARLIEEL